MSKCAKVQDLFSKEDSKTGNQRKIPGQKGGKLATPCTAASPPAFRAAESTRKFTADGAAHSSISALRSNDEATAANGVDAAVVSTIPSFFFRRDVAHRNRILPDDDDDDSGRIAAIPARPVPRVSHELFSIILTVSFFKRVPGPTVRRERNDFARRVSPRHISLRIVLGMSPSLSFSPISSRFRNISADRDAAQLPNNDIARLVRLC